MKKKMFSFLLIISMALTWIGGIAQASENSRNSGGPTQEEHIEITGFLAAIDLPDLNAVLITTAEELANIEKGHFVLGADIDLATYNDGNWSPIIPTGDIILDGQGHSISFKNCGYDSNWLFGDYSGCSLTIKNLGVEDINCGGIVNACRTQTEHYNAIEQQLNIKNCFACGTTNLGLLVGTIDSHGYLSYGSPYKSRLIVQISDCYVKGGGETCSGGFIGICSSTSSGESGLCTLIVNISDSVSYVEATAKGGSHIGGFIGDLDDYNSFSYLSFSNCEYRGKIKSIVDESSRSSSIGGMVGYSRGFSIIFDNCTVNGQFYPSGNETIGIFVGNSYSYKSYSWPFFQFTSKCYYYGDYPLANVSGNPADEFYIANLQNAVKLNKGPDNVDPIDPPDDTASSVYFFSGWDPTTRSISFDEQLSPYYLAASIDAASADALVGKYVLATVTKNPDSVLEVVKLQPVESKIGMVTDVIVGNGSQAVKSLQFDDGTYAVVGSPYISDDLIGKTVLYHLHTEEIVKFEALEKKTGVLEAWDNTTRQATIDGTVYPTNYLSNLSFQDNINQYLGQKIRYSVSGNSDYKPLIRIDELVKAETNIAVFSTEKSLTVQTGSSMWLGFGKISDGKLAGDWSKMAIVVSDPTVISLSEYEGTDYGYSLEVTGKKQGATNVTITDTESGASTIIAITVRDSYVGTYSYAIDRMETFYPNNEWERNTQTNIYNLNGLYVNNYRASKEGVAYTVSFDVYNSRYHTGAVDIYDANGNWIDCEEIKKFSMISSLWDAREQDFYLISDLVSGKLLTYEQASFAEHTSISIKVPDGGYFTISNNFAESPGTFLFNSCDILYDGTCTLINAALDVKNDKVALSTFSDLVKNKITKDKTIREQFIGIFKKTAQKEARKCLKKFVTNEIDDRYAGISGLFENLLNSLDISWKHFFKTATGVGESTFEKFAGPAGIVLKGCFAFAKGSNQLVQAVHLAASIDVPYVTVFSSISEGVINPHGVIINTNGNMDAEAVLQVFRVSNNDTIEVVLDGNGDHLKKYELYNICFVKNDQLVQPNGKVIVRIPIPDGMKEDTCNIYRQEMDESWTMLTAHIDGNYLVFETDHFSLYGIVGEVDVLSILSLPSKTQYNVGDTLDAFGLVLSLDGKQITDGFVCEPTVLSQEGSQEIAVQYGLASTKFRVSVKTSSGSEGSGGGSTGSGSSSGDPSSSGGSSSSNTISIPSVAGGKISVNPKTAVKGTTVTITVTPDSGYELDGITVKDSRGNTLELVDKGGGKYTFTMPNRAITVSAAFKQIEDSSITTTAPDWVNPFSDVVTNAWYYDAIKFVNEDGLMNGISSNLFAPDANLSRAQLTQILYNKEGKPASSDSSIYTDVSNGAWYAAAIAWASGNSIVEGYGNNLFGPNDSITREQLAVMLWRYVGKPTANGELPFNDASQISNYALPAMRWAVGNGILNGKGSGILDPKGFATRAQVAQIFTNYLGNKM